MARVLPPGIDESSFDSALSRFREIVGDKWVTCAESDLVHLRDLHPVTEGDQFEASAVVAPESTDQVQALVRVAKEFGIPLAPISPDPTNWYGGPVPQPRGTVVVDTGARMNRILEVSEKYEYPRRAHHTR